jgi:hypothetical protein
MQTYDDSPIANKGDEPRKSSIEELALHYTPNQHEKQAQLHETAQYRPVL